VLGGSFFFNFYSLILCLSLLALASRVSSSSQATGQCSWQFISSAPGAFATSDIVILVVITLAQLESHCQDVSI
jgi:hypothetical protein